jgi:hypothetical protein
MRARRLARKLARVPADAPLTPCQTPSPTVSTPPSPTSVSTPNPLRSESPVDIDRYNLDQWHPGTDYSIPPRPLNPQAVDYRSNLPELSPNTSFFKLLNQIAHRGDSIINGWTKIRAIDIRGTYYGTGRHINDFIDFRNDVAILLSNSIQTTMDLYDAWKAVRSPIGGCPEYDRHLLLSRTLRSLLEGCTVRLRALLATLDAKIERTEAYFAARRGAAARRAALLPEDADVGETRGEMAETADNADVENRDGGPVMNGGEVAETTDSTAVDSGGDGTVMNVGEVAEMDYSAAVDKGVGVDVVAVVDSDSDAVASKRKQGAKRQRQKQKQKQKQKPNRFAAPAEPRMPQGIHVGEWIAGVECTGIHRPVIDLT